MDPISDHSEVHSSRHKKGKHRTHTMDHARFPIGKPSNLNSKHNVAGLRPVYHNALTTQMPSPNVTDKVPVTCEFELKFYARGGVGHLIIGGGLTYAGVKNLTTGEVAHYTIASIGIGVGLSSFGITSKPIRFSAYTANPRGFHGYGYIGGGSFQIVRGISVGGGLKIPNAPFIPGDTIDLSNYGGLDIGVSHNLTYWYLRD